MGILGKLEHNNGKKYQEKNCFDGFYFSFTHNNPPFFMSIPAVTEQRTGYSVNLWSSAVGQYKQTFSLIAL